MRIFLSKMEGAFLTGFFVLTYLSGVLLVSPTESVVQVTSNDLYTESPCELRALSAFRDIQGNVWGVGEGNLWWFNATNLSWSLLPLPPDAGPNWRVACVDPRRYVALVGGNASLLLMHLPWQHWQPGDADGAVDATWCVGGTMRGADAASTYLLDAEEVKWVFEGDLLDRHQEATAVATWVGERGEMILAEEGGRVVVSNATTVNATGPGLREGALSLAWSLGDRLWLWRESELWAFDRNTTSWTRGRPKLPPLANVLTGWTDGDRFCVLKRSNECTSQYSVSGTLCFLDNEIMDDGTEETSTTTTNNNTTTTTMSSTSSSSAPSPPAVVIAARHDEWRAGEEDVAISPSIANWHQHTSVFGSVIFFGTSITIFAIFGLFWCVRKCVHFPKEALLLRDPPSVRYTAIPDSVGYDSRRPTPATYTVIPDSMA